MALPSFAEIEKSRKERMTKINSGVVNQNEGVGLPSFQEIENERARRKAYERSANMQNRLQSWMDEHNSFLQSYADRFGGRDGDYSTLGYVKDAQDWYDSAAEKGSALGDTASKLLEDLQRDSYIYGDEYVKAVSELLTTGRDVYAGITETAKGDVDFWAQFNPTEQQKAAGYDTAEKVYDAWRTDNKYRTKHEGKSRDEINRAILYAEDEAEADWLRQRETELWTSADEQARYDRAEAERQKLYVEGGADYFDEHELRRMEYLLDTTKDSHNEIERLKIQEKYGSLQNNADFSAMSAMPIDDGDKPKKYDLMESLEKQRYHYLYHKEGKQAADEYYDTLSYALNARRQQKNAEEWTEYAQDNPLLADAVSVGGKLAGVVGAADALFQKIGNDLKGDYYKPIDYNTAGMTPTVVSSAIRNERARQWSQGTKGVLDALGIDNENGVVAFDPEEHRVLSKLFNGKSAGDLYQLGMSMIDSRVSSVFGPKLGSLLLAGSAATQTMQGVASGGGSDEQALAMGFTAGLAEWFFEKYEIEGLLGEDKNVLRSVVKQGITEGFGEGATSIANIVADNIIMARNSDINTAAAEYQKQHPEWTQEQCLKEAWLDAAIGVGWDAVGGAFTGGLQGGTSSVVHNAVDRIGQWAQNKNGKADSLQGITNAVSNPLKSYPKAKRNVIQSFIDAADQKIKSFAQSVKAGDKTFRREKISDVSNRAASDIGALLGIDVSGYTNNINTNGMQHIINRHGENGAHDSTMAIDDDIARVGWVLEHYDSVELLTENGEQMYSSEFRDSNDNPAPQIRFIKKIDGTYYVVEAACENKHKKLWVQSTYLQKNEDVTQAPAEGNQTNHETDAQSALASPSSLTSISDSVPGVNGENVSALTALAAEKVDLENGADEEASAEGRAILDEKAVDVAEIADAGNGKVVVKLTDGRTVDAAELSFPEDGEQELWRVIGKYAEDADSARALLEEYRNGSLDAFTYARGVEEAFLYGKVNLSEKEMDLKSNIANQLSPSQRKEAYTQGRIAGEKKAQQRQDKLAADNKTSKGIATPAEQARNDRKVENRKKGQLHFEGDRGKLTARQKVSLQACEIVAKALGIQVYVFESEKVGSTRVGDNGWYDPKDGSIHIDLYAGQNAEGVMVFTLAHELGHFIKDWSPAKFRTLSKFLAEQYAKKGQSVAELVRDQQRRAAEDNRTLSFEEAHEEWVCDSLETMLTDGTILEKLALLQARDKSLVEKIRTFLNDFGKRLKDAYKSLNPMTKEGRIVAEMVDAASELQDLFTDALLDARENFQKAEKNTTGEGGVRFSMRYSDAIGKLEDGTLDRLENTHLKLFDETPKLYIEKAGAKNLKIIMGWDIAYLAMRKSGDIPGNYHGLGAEIMREIPAAIENPLYIVKQKNGRIAAITEIVVKGKRPVFVSIELDAFKTITQEGVYEDDNYNLVVTVMDAHLGYLKNTVFLGDVVYNKNNEAPAHFIARLKMLNKAVPTNDLAEASKVSIRNPDGIVKENDSTEKRSSSRSGAVSDRAMLVDLFEQMVTDSSEYKALQNYKKNMDRMMATEEQLERVSEEIKRISFSEGSRDMEYLNKLKQLQKNAVQELNRYDNILLGLEKSGVLRAMIERNRKLIIEQTREKTREYYRQKNETREAEIRQYYRESRRQAVERHDKAQVRQQIRKDVKRLDSLLNRGTKEKNVKLELQDFAGAALRTAKGAFLKNYNEYDMVRSGVNATMTREQKAIFARCQELLKELDEIRDQRSMEPAPDSIHERWDPEADLRLDDREEALKKELSKNMAVLREAGIFKLENELLEDSIADQLMDELMAAYNALKDSENAHVRGVFSTAIYNQMESVKKFLAGKAIKDMTAIELGELKKMYRMVLHTITTSNDLFAQQRKTDVRKLGEEVIAQLWTAGKEMTPEILDTLAKMGWANLKPETALELIGSDTLTEMMQGLYRGEDTYARDLEHAKQYAQEQGKKYGRDKWDLKKSMEFAGTKITLGQAMSLYAYTKRKQAQGHLEGEGFTHSSSVRIKSAMDKLPIKMPFIMNATKTHIVSKGMYEQVADLLTPQQRKYVDAMQDYLSKVMGAKGNEVSMQLYGVKLFEETMYFPLKTASEYREEALGATSGEVKLKNSGFTNTVVEKASNPIVLDSFEDVWAGHVDKMSLYHGFVLPMEDFDRVYNYRHAEEQEISNSFGEVVGSKLVDTNESVKVDIENKMGKAANAYIEDLMKQLNGGVRGDSTEKLFGTMVRNFKKTAVLGSLSVAVQQPTAFVRAMAYLDIRDVGNPKDFLGKAGKPEGKILDEMYKYAPVALMKRIGGFDPGLGRTTRDYVFEDKQGITEALDKFLGKFPEKMDEWTWSYIWICTKRQIHRQHPDLTINSEAFLQKVGERFSKIIRDTQVYDSVLTKSQVMRSKNVFLQMATAFMNEPTTSMDMYIRSTIQAKRGKIKKSQAARTYAAVVGSQLLTSAVVSFVYALRDDDEDEIYWEKYLSAMVGKAWENTMPWYSIPFVKDIFSVFDGYSVERSDMSLIVDLYQGWQKLMSNKATPWEKTEAFAGSILNLFGIPLKNVSRDIRGVWNTINTWITGGVEKTAAGLRYAALEGLTGKKASKAEQLQNAVAENDVKHILRVMASYISESSARTAFRSAVKAAYLQGDVTDAQAVEFLKAYAGDDAAEAQEKVAVWDFKKQHPDTELKDGKIPDYMEFAEPAGISLEIYTEYCEKKSGYTKRDDILKVINKLPISKAQKDALYYAEGYAESTLDDAPWH